MRRWISRDSGALSPMICTRASWFRTSNVISALMLSRILRVPGIVSSKSTVVGLSASEFSVRYNSKFSCSASVRVTNDSRPRPPWGLLPSKCFRASLHLMMRSLNLVVRICQNRPFFITNGWTKYASITAFRSSLFRALVVRSQPLPLH
jgi:hypothetical protein